VGGPNTPGVLVAKKALFTNSTPTVPGGGTVFYVTENDHRYLSNRIEREEGGTPDIVGSIRTGMAFHVKQVIGVARIEQLEHQLWSHAKSFLINEPNVALLGNLDAQRLPM
jgi:selenocysteine lyase/cysteine desulfurase